MNNADREWDDILARVVKAIQEEESGVQVIIPKRMKEFSMCAEVMKELFRGKGTKIEVIPHNEFPSVGTIRITTKSLSIRDPQLFARAAALAHNYEIYPKLNGTIVMAFTFYDMTRKVKE